LGFTSKQELLQKIDSLNTQIAEIELQIAAIDKLNEQNGDIEAVE